MVLTDFVDTISAELMVENLDRLSRRHLVIFIALQDPGLAATAAQAPASLLEMNRAVVAVSPRLINTYLDVKRRERI